MSLLPRTLARLLFTVCICLCAVSANYRRPSKGPRNCCVRVSDTYVKAKLTGFRIQEANPPCVKAIVLFTNKRKFCTDPKAPWINQKLKELPKEIP